MLEAALETLSQVSAGQVLTAGFAAFATSILTGLSGFGGGFALSIIIAPIVGIQAVVPVMAIVNFIANVTRVFVFRESLHFPALRSVLVTAVPGVILGAIVYAHMPVDAIAIFLGFFLLTSVPARRLMARRRIHIDGRGLAVAGFGYGVLNSSTMGTRMLLVPVLLGAGLFGPVQLATAAAVTVALNTVKITVFSGYGLLPPSLLLAGCLMGLCTVPGTYVARWLVNRMQIHVHTILMEALLVVGASYFIWQGLSPQ